MSKPAPYVTRFAPSPTGPLHLGHAYSALLAFDRAQARGGTCLLRIEDGDTARARAHWEQQIYADLTWLGLHWPTPVLRVSDRATQYMAALDRLAEAGLTYPCNCTRKDILAATSAPQEGAAMGPDGPIYPGTCRNRAMTGQRTGDAIRLNMARACALLPKHPLRYTETGPDNTGPHQIDPTHLIENIGDIVLFRKDINTAAYHLSVVVDDAAQNITEAVRGADLIPATPIHRLLQALLDLPTPAYHHHALIRDHAGKRLAKRSDAQAIAQLRADGASPADIRRQVGLPITAPPKNSAS